MTFDVKGCCRCGGDHDQLRFKELTHAVEIPVGDDTIRYTHWAPCPTNKEPVLLRGVALTAMLSRASVSVDGEVADGQ